MCRRRRERQLWHTFYVSFCCLTLCDGCVGQLVHLGKAREIFFCLSLFVIGCETLRTSQLGFAVYSPYWSLSLLLLWKFRDGVARLWTGAGDWFRDRLFVIIRFSHLGLKFVEVLEIVLLICAPNYCHRNDSIIQLPNLYFFHLSHPISLRTKVDRQ